MSASLVRICVAAIVAGGLCLAPPTAPAQNAIFRTPQAKPLMFLENKADGTSVRHLGLEARLAAEPNVSKEAMAAHAKSLFETELQRISEAIAGSDFVFVTFDLGPAVVEGREGRRTYRVGFLREGVGWRQLTPP